MTNNFNNDYYNNMVLGGKTMAEWDAEEQEQSQYALDEGISYDDAVNLGLLETPQAEPQQQENHETREFQKLSVGDTLKDVGVSTGKEAMKLFVPKKDGLANKALNKVGLGGYNEENFGLDYQAKTRVGETFKYLYRYGAGTLSFIFGGGKVGAVVKAAGIAKGSKTMTSIGAGLQKLMTSDKLFKTSKGGVKAAGVWLANNATSGILGGAMADFTLYRPEEGHMADMFGNADWARPFQTQEDDTQIEGKMKNVIEGMVMGGLIGTTVAPMMRKAFSKWWKANKTAITTESETEALSALQEAAEASQQIKQVTNTNDVYNAVREFKAKADLEGVDASELIQNNIPKEYQSAARDMLDIMDKGDDIFIHDDGTFDIRVSNWEDAAKVSREEYDRQLRNADEVKAKDLDDVRYGDTALGHMDAATKSTWENRGWLGEGDSSLVKVKTDKDGYEVSRTVNKTTANKIAKNYADKWEIDNNVKVEVVDGLKDKDGNPVSGRTESTKYQGKTTTNKQNAIDKQKLKISKLEDKITQEEGGNAPVTDVLDNLKEELRIAKNELKELEKANKKQNRIPNITIKIDANCENPHAVLRSELEHARDIAKGTVPDQNVKHFSRYDGMNESEVASGYVHKKSTSRSLQNDMNTLNDKENMLSSKVEDTNVSETNSRRTTEDERSLRQENEGSSRTDGRGVDSTVHEGVQLDKSRLGNSGLARELVNSKVNKDYYLLNNSLEASNKFVDALNLAKESQDVFGKQVYTYTPEEYSQMKVYLSKDSKMGFAIKPDGDLVSVFIHKDKSGKGLSHKLIELAKQQGATKLDCYDTYLTNLYKKHGFIEVKRDKWNDKYAPEGWSKDKLGEPDVVYMELAQQQLKLDFKSIEDVADAVGKGEFKHQTIKDVDNLVKELEKFTPYEKTTWKEIAEDVDNNPMVKEVIESLSPEKMLEYSGNPAELEALIKKELSAFKFQDVLTQKLLTTTDKAAKREIMNSISKLQDVIEAYRSYSGLALNVQKASHIIEDAFADKNLTNFMKQGIVSLADIIENSLKKIDLNFTKGELVNKKNEIIASILENADADLFRLLKDADLSLTFDNAIEKILKDKNFDKDLFIQDIKNTVIDKQINYLENIVKQAPTTEGQRKTLVSWQGLQSYYVHNLLSGVGTICKNVLSGAMNTLYYPCKKMLAGAIFGGGDAMYKEGLGTLNAMLSNWNDAWLLAKQAFINGEGAMTNIGKDTMAETQQAAFNQWGKEDVSLLEHLQNLHSFMTRLMGATDEFMSQFNYRSIVKAKAYSQVEEAAKQIGKQNDQKWIDEQAQKLFSSAFDRSGRPLDINAYYESKSILYQNQLDGRAFDVAKGQQVQMRDRTWAMKFGAGLNSAIASDKGLGGTTLKLLFPFVKTGVNILQQNLDHNLLYALCSKSQRDLLFSKTSEGALARSQVAFGCFSLTMASVIAMCGGITGSLPRDPKERKALLATGWRPYSIVTPNGQYISYQGYEPLHTILGFAADCVELGTSIATDEDYRNMEKIFTEGQGIILNNFLDKAAFRSGLDSLNVLFDTDGNTIEQFKKVVANTTAGLLPDASFVKGASTFGNRDAKTPKTFMDRWLNMYFNRGLGEYRRNCFGEKQNLTNLIITNGASLEHTPENDELLRLAEFGFKPSEITDVIAKTNYNYKDFTDDKGRNAYDYMMEALSESGLREAVRDLVTSPEYQELPDGVLTEDAKANGVKFTSADETKINALKALFIEYNNKAKEDVMFDHPELTNKEGVSLGDAQEESLSNKLNLLINQGINNNLEELNNFY